MATPRKPLPRAQAEIVDTAIMEASAALHEIQQATKQPIDENDHWKLTAKNAIAFSNIILTLKTTNKE